MKRIGTLLLAAGGLLALGTGIGAAAAEQPAPNGESAAAKRGETLFESFGCTFCHENGGRAAGKGPKLAGTKSTDSFLTFRIKHGKEADMPAFGAVFTDAQIADIIAYIRSL
jgi:mono/diheme cytochrome c family protein